ncbi:HYC_CC_PP family protein [Chitinophaga japonensis]
MVVYLSSSVGANVYRHYCMNRLVAWGVGDENSMSDACSYCGMGKTSPGEHCRKQASGCCHNEHQLIKIEKDQKKVDENVKLAKPYLLAITQFPVEFYNVFVPSAVTVYPTTHAPPATGKVTLFIRNCVFRI